MDYGLEYGMVYGNMMEYYVFVHIWNTMAYVFFGNTMFCFWPHIFHNTMFYGIVYAIRELWFMYYYCYWSSWSYYTWAKLVQIAPITIFSGVYKPTYSWRAPHCSHGGTPVAGSEKKILYIYNLYVYSFFGVPAFQKSLHWTKTMEHIKILFADEWTVF